MTNERERKLYRALNGLCLALHGLPQESRAMIKAEYAIASEALDFALKDIADSSSSPKKIEGEITFHKFIQDKRVEKEITLREFCREMEIDPSNWSKVERGLAEPPKNTHVLTRIAEVLKLDDQATHTLFYLAAVAIVPKDLRDILFKDTPELSGSTGKEKESLEIFQRCRVCNGSGKLMSTEYECATCGGSGGAMRTLREPIKEESAEELKPEDVKADFVCGSCGAQLDNMKQANEHMTMHNPAPVESAEKGYGNIKSIEEIFANGSSRTTHLPVKVESADFLEESYSMNAPNLKISADNGEWTMKTLHNIQQRTEFLQAGVYRFTVNGIEHCKELLASLNSAQRSGNEYSVYDYDHDLRDIEMAFDLMKGDGWTAEQTKELVMRKIKKVISHVSILEMKPTDKNLSVVDKRVTLTDEEIVTWSFDRFPQTSGVKDPDTFVGWRKGAIIGAKWVRSLYEGDKEGKI